MGPEKFWARWVLIPWDGGVAYASSHSVVFLGFYVLELGPMYAPDARQTEVRQKHRLMPPPYGGGGIRMNVFEFL